MKKEAYVVLYISDNSKLSVCPTDWSAITDYESVEIFLSFDDYVEGNFSNKWRLSKANGYSLITFMSELKKLYELDYNIHIFISQRNVSKVEEAERYAKRKAHA